MTVDLYRVECATCRVGVTASESGVLRWVKVHLETTDGEHELKAAALRRPGVVVDPRPAGVDLTR